METMVPLLKMFMFVPILMWLLLWYLNQITIKILTIILSLMMISYLKQVVEHFYLKRNAQKVKEVSISIISMNELSNVRSPHLMRMVRELGENMLVQWHCVLSEVKKVQMALIESGFINVKQQTLEHLLVAVMAKSHLMEKLMEMLLIVIL